MVVLKSPHNRGSHWHCVGRVSIVGMFAQLTVGHSIGWIEFRYVGLGPRFRMAERH